MNSSKISRAVLAGTIISIATVVILTVAADLAPPLKDSLKNAFTHHWVGKSVVVTIAFLLITIASYASRSGSRESDLPQLLRILSFFVIFGTALI